MIINFRKATNRKTECYYINIGSLELTISYETIIAARDGKKAIRQKNHWGPTTGKHFKESGTYDYAIIENQSDFNSEIDKMVELALK